MDEEVRFFNPDLEKEPPVRVDGISVDAWFVHGELWGDAVKNICENFHGLGQ